MKPFDVPLTTATGLFDQIAYESYAKPDLDEEAMRSRLGIDAGASIERWDLLGAIRDFAHYESWGLWFDHNENYVLRDRLLELIDTRIGRPDEYFMSDSDYEDFGWQESDGDVPSGLVALDKWFDVEAEFQRRKDIRELWEGESPREIVGLRLVEVYTGADWYLALLSPANEVERLKGWLAACGLLARDIKIVNEGWHEPLPDPDDPPQPPADPVVPLAAPPPEAAADAQNETSLHQSLEQRKQELFGQADKPSKRTSFWSRFRR